MISTAFTRWQPVRWYIDTFSMEPRRIRNISRAGLHRVLPTQERWGSVCGSWKMFPRHTPVVSSYDPIHPPDPQNSPTYWTLAIWGQGTCLANGVDDDHSRLLVV